MSNPAEDDLSSLRERRQRRVHRKDPLDAVEIAAARLGSLIDRFAMLKHPDLAAALGITHPGAAQDRAAAQIAMICSRAPQLVSRLPADRVAVLQNMFPGTNLDVIGTRSEPVQGVEFQHFRRAVEDLAEAMNRVPNPSTASDRAERAQRSDALGMLSPVPAAFIDALPPAHAGLVRHLTEISPLPAGPAPTRPALSKPALRAVGGQLPGTPGSRHLPLGSPQGSRHGPR